jgi:hypothetical protein
MMTDTSQFAKCSKYYNQTSIKAIFAEVILNGSSDRQRAIRGSKNRGRRINLDSKSRLSAI